MSDFHTATHLVSVSKPRPPFDRLRANGILIRSTAFFRFNRKTIDSGDASDD